VCGSRASTNIHMLGLLKVTASHEKHTKITLRNEGSMFNFTTVQPCTF